MTSKPSPAHGAIATISLGMSLACTCAASASGAPPIRLSTGNQVPACVTPARLDAFLSDQITKRGYRLHAPHRNIAKWYREHGQTHRVRWDYAFFQMALETNFLSFRRGNGKPGDVVPRQNNFAGLGTTGGGVPGDSYPDASTGVLAQIQHLVVYSGERLRNPVGHRTRLKQDVILSSISKIARRRPVTFADLARRWAADRHYGRSIQRLAKLFYSGYCRDLPGNAASSVATSARQRLAPASSATVATAPSQQSATRPSHQTVSRASKVSQSAFLARPNLIAKLSSVARQPTVAAEPAAPTRTKPVIGAAKSCRVQAASYGGNRAVLIESTKDGVVRLTALNVHPGFEDMMANNFIQSHDQTGKKIGAFDSRDAAISKAHDLCRKRTGTAAN